MAAPARPLSRFLCAASLARAVGRPSGLVTTFLARLRIHRHDCFIVVENPRRGEPRYLYRVGDIWDALVIWSDNQSTEGEL